MARAAFWTAAALLALARPAAAEPPSPLDLVRGLREQGMPDLALEYLDQIEKQNPTGDLKIVLPLERAQTRLQLAQLAADEGARAAAVARAGAEFDAFLKAHPKHPRAPEASLSLARVLSLQAKSALNRAYRLDEVRPADRKAAAAATRPLFRRAADLFGRAAKQAEAVLNDSATDPARKRDLTREAVRAELDRGVNLFTLADTYGATATITPQEVDERAKALAEAKAVFADLGRRDDANPLCWVARAWAGACDLELSEKAKADDAFRRIRAEAGRVPAAADGVRMVEFFEMQAKYQEARASKAATAVRAARAAARQWLDRDKYRPRMTPERASAGYYHAYLTYLEATLTGVRTIAGKGGEKPRLDVSSAARGLLQEANREYKRLLELDTEYSDRAGRDRAAVIRLLVGDAAKPAAEYTDFEQCQMAAIVHLTSDEDQAASLPKAIELLERCRQLAGSGVPAKEKTEAELMLAFAYLRGGRPADAAAVAEPLARTAKGADAARAGVYAIEAHLAARDKLPEADGAGRAAARDRAVALGRFLDQTHPTDPATDAVRFRLGRLFADEKQYRDAFDVLGKISPSYPAAAAARLLQCRAAYRLTAPDDAPLPETEQREIMRKAVADAEAVLEPAGPTELRAYLALRTMLAQLHLSTRTPDGYRRAEQAAADAARRARAAPLPEADRLAAAFAADEVRLRAVYAQAVPLYKAGKSKELFAKLDPVIAEIGKAGPAAAKLDGDAAVAADGLDRFRREVVILVLQARIRDGAAEPAAQLFDLLAKLGGSAEATTDALARLVTLVRPQIDELRKQGKGGDADRLAGSVGALIQKQAAKPKPAARTLALLGRSLRELGDYDKAAEVLTKVPSAPAEDLAKRSTELTDEQRAAVIAHHVAQLELARAYRGAKQFDKADEVLKAALGTDAQPGWAKSLEFRREAVLLLEDKAADAPPDQKQKRWVEAKAGWTKLARDYAAVITAKLPADADQRAKAVQDKEKLIPVYLGLLGDEKRCLARANTQLLKDRSDALAKALAALAEQVYAVEVGNQRGLTTEVRLAFAALLDDYPQMKDEYRKRGGTAFLNPTAEGPAEPAGK